MKRFLAYALTVFLMSSLAVVRAADPLVLYTFREGSGKTVHDVSGNGTPLDVIGVDAGSLKWLPGRGLRITDPTLLASVGPATKIIEACMATNEITIEAWVKPSSDELGGPARIVTCSVDPSNRNFTMGQDIEKPVKGYQIRLRTPIAGVNGSDVRIEEPGDTVVLNKTSKLVYTRNAAGEAKFYINGEEIATKQIDGDFSNWDASYRLGMGNELDLAGERFWLGELYYIAIYNEAIHPDQLPDFSPVEPAGKLTSTWAGIKASR